MCQASSLLRTPQCLSNLYSILFERSALKYNLSIFFHFFKPVGVPGTLASRTPSYRATPPLPELGPCGLIGASFRRSRAIRIAEGKEIREGLALSRVLSMGHSGRGAPEDRKLDNAGPWAEYTVQPSASLSPLLRTVTDLMLFIWLWECFTVTLGKHTNIS